MAIDFSYVDKPEYQAVDNPAQDLATRLYSARDSISRLADRNGEGAISNPATAAHIENLSAYTDEMVRLRAVHDAAHFKGTDGDIASARHNLSEAVAEGGRVHAQSEEHVRALIQGEVGVHPTSGLYKNSRPLQPSYPVLAEGVAQPLASAENGAASEVANAAEPAPSVGRFRRFVNGLGSRKLHRQANDARALSQGTHEFVSNAGIGDRSEAIMGRLAASHNDVAKLQNAYDEAIRTGVNVDGARRNLTNATEHLHSVSGGARMAVSVIKQNNEVPEVIESAAPAVANSGAEKLVIKEEGRMAGIGEKIMDGARATRSGLWKATKTTGKWAGIATIGAVGIGFMANKIGSRARESQDELSNQAMAAQRAAAASPMVGAPTLMGMEPTPGALAARVQAARSGSPEQGPLNPEVDRNYQVIS